jgi:hypothetical protein
MSSEKLELRSRVSDGLCTESGEKQTGRWKMKRTEAKGTEERIGGVAQPEARYDQGLVWTRQNRGFSTVTCSNSEVHASASTIGDCRSIS